MSIKCEAEGKKESSKNIRKVRNILYVQSFKCAAKAAQNASTVRICFVPKDAIQNSVSSLYLHSERNEGREREGERVIE